MPNLQFADRLLKQGRGILSRLRPAGRLLRERLVEGPLRFAAPYLKKGLVMRPLLFSFIVIGVVLIFLGVREYRQSSAASPAVSASSPSGSAPSGARSDRPAPRDVTCRDFAGQGPGDRAYVRLTDFEFTDHYTHRKGDQGWDVVCVPAVEPRKIDNPGVRVPKVLVKSNQTRNPRDLYELSRRPIEGIVVRGIDSLPLEDQSLLRKHYSYLNLDQCWILEAGRVPAVSASASAATGGNPSAGDNAVASAGGSRGGIGKIGGGAGLAVIAVGALLLAGRRP